MTLVRILQQLPQLFHATFRHHFGKLRLSLLPVPSPREVGKKPIRCEDKNAGKHKGLKPYLEKVKKVSYVNEIFIENYKQIRYNGIMKLSYHYGG